MSLRKCFSCVIISLMTGNVSRMKLYTSYILPYIYRFPYIYCLAHKIAFLIILYS
uniref:Uncharacterized protein n=1 Tax=Octopus bimaculoides TaxID=37653 RepID=A0A0L8H924_OCTBM